MAKNSGITSAREVYALVFAYLLKVDTAIAQRYQQITNADRPHKKAPSLEDVVHCYRASGKTGSYDDGADSENKREACKSQTPRTSACSIGLPKKRAKCSPSPCTQTGQDVKSFKKPSVSKTGDMTDLRVGNFKAVASEYKRVVKKKDSGSAVKRRKSGHSRPVHYEPDPTWVPRQSHPAFHDAVDSTPEYSDTDSDSGLDEACSVFSSVSSRAADDLPCAPGDAWVRCDQCGRLWEDGACLLHGPPIAVPDSAVPADTPPLERAVRSVPAVLRVGPSGVHRGGLGVWARRPLPAGLRFGPYRGRRQTSRARASAGGCSWEVYRHNRLWFCVDAADPAHANWMRYVNCAPSAADENVTAYQHRWRIWYRTCRPIPRDTELLVYYGDEYKRELAREASGKRRRW